MTASCGTCLFRLCGRRIEPYRRRQAAPASLWKADRAGCACGEAHLATVLIVDDSKLARIVVGKAVSALQPDWTRVEAGNADEASSILDSQPVDVMILDFNMPGRNG